MVLKKEINELLNGVDLNKLTNTELLVLNSKLKLLHEALKTQIIDKLDEEDYIFKKSIEILQVINNRI